MLQKRFNKIKKILNLRLKNLTILIEAVNKPHNLSAILRTCDAIGVLEANFICDEKKVKTFNNTAQGSQKWVKLRNHKSSKDAISFLKDKGFKLYGATLNKESLDYRNIDFTGNTCFVMGAEKWGLSSEVLKEVDQCIHIPMYGMVQSLNVSVASAVLLYEAIRQRDEKGLLPSNGEGLSIEEYEKTLFEWSYPELAKTYKEYGKKYPKLDLNGEIYQ
tara:strand:- start:130 stop:783 length:654 start_codon:yes stop_codon:yes gene_type:complete